MYKSLVILFECTGSWNFNHGMYDVSHLSLLWLSSFQLFKPLDRNTLFIFILFFIIKMVGDELEWFLCLWQTIYSNILFERDSINHNCYLSFMKTLMDNICEVSITSYCEIQTWDFHSPIQLELHTLIIRTPLSIKLNRYTGYGSTQYHLFYIINIYKTIFKKSYGEL